jgi:hypothetical protein
VRRLTVDHQAGKLGRDALLTDETGLRILPLAGDVQPAEAVMRCLARHLAWKTWLLDGRAT